MYSYSLAWLAHDMSLYSLLRWHTWTHPHLIVHNTTPRLMLVGMYSPRSLFACSCLFAREYHYCRKLICSVISWAYEFCCTFMTKREFVRSQGERVLIHQRPKATYGRLREVVLEHYFLMVTIVFMWTAKSLFFAEISFGTLPWPETTFMNWKTHRETQKFPEIQNPGWK